MNKEELLKKHERLTLEIGELQEKWKKAYEEIKNIPLKNEQEIRKLIQEISMYNINVLKDQLSNELHIATQRLISKRTVLTKDREKIVISNVGIGIERYLYHYTYIKTMHASSALKYYADVASNFGSMIIKTIHKDDRKEIIQLIMDNRALLQKLAERTEVIEKKFPTTLINLLRLEEYCFSIRRIQESFSCLKLHSDGKIYLYNDASDWTLKKTYLTEKDMTGYNERYLLSALLKNPTTKKAIYDLVEQYKKENKEMVEQIQELLKKLNTYTIIEAI